MNIFIKPRNKKSAWLTILLFTFASFFCVEQVHASHFVGGDVEYTCTGQKTWKIKLTLYRDCTGATICNAPCSTTCTVNMSARPAANADIAPFSNNGCSPSSYNIPLTLSLVEVKDAAMIVAPTCPLPKNGCTNTGCNTPNNAAPLPWVEKYVFEGTLNLNNPLFPTGCCFWEVFWEDCCRNAIISTIQNPGGTGFRIGAIINICEGATAVACKNNSPVLTNETFSAICSGREQFFNMGADDPDQDSLSYALVAGKDQGGAPITYVPPFVPTSPLPINPLKPITINPPGSGFACDPVKGDINFVPIGGGATPIVGVLTIQIKQWRRSASGQPILVGITHRDIQFFIKACPDNDPPWLITSPAGPFNRAKTSWEVCAGQNLCFTVTAKDTNNIQPHIDSTFLGWNEALAKFGATFQPTYPYPQKDRALFGPREDQWQFCWQTEEEHGRSLPYYFIVRAVDSRCENPASVMRSFSITVKPLAKAVVSKSKGPCGKYTIRVTKTDTTQTFIRTSIEVSREPWDFGFVNNPYTFSTSSNQNPIINRDYTFTQGGKYLVRVTISTPGPQGEGPCEKFYFDTITVDTPVKAFAPVLPYACQGGSVLLAGRAQWGKPIGYLYRWFRNDTLGIPINNSSPQDPNVTVSPTVDTKYILKVQDLDGCISFDSTTVTIKPLPQPRFAPDSTRICYGDSFTLDPGNNNGNVRSYRWYRDGIILTDTTPTITRWDSARFFILMTDTFGCQQRDTFRLFVNQQIFPNAGLDTNICPGDTVTLVGAGGYKYQWERLSPASVILAKGYANSVRVNPNQTTTYVLTAFVSYPDTAANYKECAVKDTVNVVFKNAPILVRPPQQNLCRSSLQAPLIQFSVNPPDQRGGTGVWSFPQAPGAITGTDPLYQALIDSLPGVPNDTTPGAAPSQAKTYYFKYKYTAPIAAGGCSKTDSTAIKVYPMPKVDAGIRERRCINSGLFWINSANTSGNAAGEHRYDLKNVPNALQNSLTEKWEVVVGSGLIETSSGLQRRYQFDPVAAAPYNILKFTYTANYSLTPLPGNLSCAKDDTVIFDVVDVPVLTVTTKQVTVCKNAAPFNISTATGASTNTNAPTFWSLAPGQPVNVAPAINAAGQTFDALNVSVPQSGGSWKVYYNDTSTGCPAKDSATINVAPIPNVQLVLDNAADSLVCITKGAVKLKGTPTTGGVGVYSGTGVAADEFNTNDPLVTGGIYKVLYSFKDNTPAGCSNADSIDIEVKQLPVLTASSDDMAKCASDTDAFVLTATIAPAVYGIKWSGGAGTWGNDTLLSTTYKFNTTDAAAHGVTLTATSTRNAPCPAASIPISLAIDPKPDPSFTCTDCEGCVPVNAKFAINNSGVTGTTYAWFLDNAATPFSTDSAHQRQFLNPSKHSVRVVATTAAGCSAQSDADTVWTHAIPDASFEATPPFTTIANPVFSFNNTSTISDGSNMTYLWNFGPDPLDPTKTRTSTVTDPQKIEFLPDTSSSSRRPVVLTVTSEFGCVDTAMRTLRIDPDITVFIPSAFRPGSNVACPDPTDDCNQSFKVAADGFATIEVFVFNRWGQQVFYTRDPKQGWKGSVNNDPGQPCPQDVYIYQINATSFNGKKYTYSGSITLLR